MSLFITSLNSGSNGNCYYIGNKNDAILVDAGISCRTVERRMKQLGLDMRLVKAVFISHEHSDHIKGVETLASKFHMPVYISEKTFQHSGMTISNGLLNHFLDGDIISIGSIKVNAFSKIHDAGDPYSFCISDGAVNIGVFTDIGTCCSNVIKWFSICHAAFLESNYDEEMLNDGPYPYFLKSRIAGGRGHLSNSLAHKIFTEHRPEYMTHLVLAHLSDKNNRPDIVENLFKSNCGDVEIVVASRHEPTRIFEVSEIRCFSVKRTTWTQASLFVE